ncbi:MAG: hypothetical protein AAF490_12380 [Chloroflexota bacterium]
MPKSPAALFRSSKNKKNKFSSSSSKPDTQPLKHRSFFPKRFFNNAKKEVDANE